MEKWSRQDAGLEPEARQLTIFDALDAQESGGLCRRAGWEAAGVERGQVVRCVCGRDVRVRTDGRLTRHYVP